MSSTSKISIHLGSTADLSSVEKTKRSLWGLGEAAGKLGSVFGGANALLGDFFRNLSKGSVRQMGASAIGFVYKKIVEHINAAKEAEKQAAKAAKEAADERLKSIADYSAAVDKLAQTRQTSVSQHLKNLNDEIDATKDLTKATLELQRAEARKRGDSAAVAEIEGRMDALDFSAAREKLTNEIAAVARRRENERATVAEREKGLSDLTAVIGKLAVGQARAIRSARERATANAMEVAGGSPSIAGGLTYAPASEKTKKRLADRAEDELRKSDEFKSVAAQIEDARKRADDFRDKLAASRRELGSLDEQERNLVTRREAIDVRERAKRTNDEADRAEERRRAAEKSAEETRRAEVAAAQKAAIERDRLDRELHQRRMADLREEIAAQSKATSPLRAVASAAQGEFERAFALYRDPKAAAAAVADEKSRAQDLDRLHADAARYGGKWRIDELSRLMAAGDAQGQSDTLAAWRKSSRFTPEVEAMVRASAAERTKTTAEDELRKIESNTADLARKLDELISMKGADKMATYQQCFGGKVERADYFQPVASIKRRVVTSTDTDGTPLSWSEGYDVWTAKVADETFRFEGLTYAQAHATDEQTVTDVDGVSHTVPFAPALTSPTYDELSWEKHSVSVQRTRISPHMWAVVVHVRNAVLYVNGAVCANQG